MCRISQPKCKNCGSARVERCSLAAASKRQTNPWQPSMLPLACSTQLSHWQTPTQPCRWAPACTQQASRWQHACAWPGARLLRFRPCCTFAPCSSWRADALRRAPSEHKRPIIASRLHNTQRCSSINDSSSEQEAAAAPLAGLAPALRLCRHPGSSTTPPAHCPSPLGGACALPTAGCRGGGGGAARERRKPLPWSTSADIMAAPFTVRLSNLPLGLKTAELQVGTAFA